MGKIEYIKSCRKEQKCSKCGSAISVSSPYYKGVMFHRPPVVRCVKCGLKSYEVTTSDFVMTVGRLVEDWREDYAIEDGTVEEVKDALQEILDTCQENFDNIPEQLQEGSAGKLLQERIEALESAIDELEDGVWSDFLQEAYDNLSEEDQAAIDLEQTLRDGADYDDWYEEFCENGHEKEVAERWKEEVEDIVSHFIDGALKRGYFCDDEFF